MVEVFQTNIENGETADAVLKVLQKRFPQYRINFDLEDRDNILRVESIMSCVEVIPIIEVVQGHGHFIVVLPDIVPK